MRFISSWPSTGSASCVGDSSATTLVIHKRRHQLPGLAPLLHPTYILYIRFSVSIDHDCRFSIVSRAFAIAVTMPDTPFHLTLLDLREEGLLLHHISPYCPPPAYTWCASERVEVLLLFPWPLLKSTSSTIRFWNPTHWSGTFRQHTPTFLSASSHTLSCPSPSPQSINTVTGTSVQVR
jgi:hypothetical protein